MGGGAFAEVGICTTLGALGFLLIFMDEAACSLWSIRGRYWTSFVASYLKVLNYKLIKCKATQQPAISPSSTPCCVEAARSWSSGQLSDPTLLHGGPLRGARGHARRAGGWVVVNLWFGSAQCPAGRC